MIVRQNKKKKKKLCIARSMFSILIRKWYTKISEDFSATQSKAQHIIVIMDRSLYVL